MKTFKKSEILNLQANKFFNPKTGNVYGSSGKLLGKVEGIKADKKLKSIKDLPVFSDPDKGKATGSPFISGDKIMMWGAVGSGLNTLGNISPSGVKWSEGLFKPIQQSSQDFEAAGFGTIKEFVDDPKHTSLLKQTDYIQAYAHTQSLLKQMDIAEKAAWKQQTQQPQTKPDLIYNGKIITSDSSMYDMYKKYGAKEIGAAEEELAEPSIKDDKLKIAGGKFEKGYETGTRGTALGNLIMEQYHANPQAKANIHFIQGMARHLYDRPATQEELDGLVGKTLEEVLKTSGSIGGYEGMAEGWTSLLGGEKGKPKEGVPQLEEKYLYIKDGKYFDQDNKWIRSMEEVTDLVENQGYKDYGKTGAPDEKEAEPTKPLVSGEKPQITPTEGVSGDVEGGVAEEAPKSLEDLVVEAVNDPNATDQDILDALEKIKTGQVDPFYKQLIQQAQDDVIGTINYEMEQRVFELQQQSYMLAENIRQTQQDLEAKGMTFGGEAIRQLGTLSAFAQATPEGLPAPSKAKELTMTPEQMGIEGIAPMKGRLMAESSKAKYQKKMEEIAKNALRYLGTEGIAGTGLEQYLPAGTPETIGTGEYQYKGTLQDVYSGLQAQKKGLEQYKGTFAGPLSNILK